LNAVLVGQWWQYIYCSFLHLYSRSRIILFC